MYLGVLQFNIRIMYLLHTKLDIMPTKWAIEVLLLRTSIRVNERLLEVNDGLIDR